MPKTKAQRRQELMSDCLNLIDDAQKKLRQLRIYATNRMDYPMEEADDLLGNAYCKLYEVS